MQWIKTNVFFKFWYDFIQSSVQPIIYSTRLKFKTFPPFIRSTGGFSQHFLFIFWYELNWSSIQAIIYSTRLKFKTFWPYVCSTVIYYSTRLKFKTFQPFICSTTGFSLTFFFQILIWFHPIIRSTNHLFNQIKV